MAAQASKSMPDTVAKEVRQGRKSGRKKRSKNSEQRIIAQCSRLLGKDVESLQYPEARNKTFEVVSGDMGTRFGSLNAD